MFRNIFFLLIIVFLITPNAFCKKIEIISKVNNKIITNQDVDDEINYLKFLNPKLEEIEDFFCDDVLSLNKDELKYRKIVKKSIFAKKDIPKGLLIDENNIISRRLLPK